MSIITGAIVFAAGLVTGWCFLERPDWVCRLIDEIKSWWSLR